MDIGSPRILVVGDVMLDVFMYVKSMNVIQEGGFDVSNCEVDKIEIGLGGAGLVADACKAMGAQVDLACVIGDDETGASIEELCQESLGNTDLIVVAEKHVSTSKTRIICDGETCLRLNVEEFPDEKYVASLLERISAMGMLWDGIIIVDYGKGACRYLDGSDIFYHISKAARSADVPCMISSKFVQFLIGTEATFVVCNLLEMNEFLLSRDDCKSLVDAGNRLVCDYLVVTNGRYGVSCCTRLSKKTVHLDGIDVGVAHSGIGAGDCLCAALMCSYVSGESIEDSLKFANEYAAASCRGSRVRTSVPSMEELVFEEMV